MMPFGILYCLMTIFHYYFQCFKEPFLPELHIEPVFLILCIYAAERYWERKPILRFQRLGQSYWKKGIIALVSPFLPNMYNIYLNNTFYHM